MTRFFSPVPALLLAAFALAGCSMMGMGDASSAAKEKDVAAVKDKAQSPRTIASDIDGNLRQATLLRQAGSNDAAIRILSQLMLADADNPRVVAEYGKTLAQMGRAQDATQFLSRAIELSANDWTLYSAMGVSYDQLGDQANARLAYEHALALKPGEPTVLNNYAMSRMLAKDPDGARLLIAQAQAAGGANPKIASNVALIASMAPQKADADKPGTEKPSQTASAVKSALVAGTPSEPKTAAAAPKPAPVKTAVAPAPAIVATARPAAPPIPVTEMPALPAPQNGAPQGPQTAGDVSKLLASQNPVMAASAAPRPLTQTASLQPQAATIMPSGVVMQAVPYDPLAGPVVKLKKPQPKAVARNAAPKSEKTDTAKADKPADAPKPEKAAGAAKTDAKAGAPLKAAAAKSDVVPSLRVAADKY